MYIHNAVQYFDLKHMGTENSIFLSIIKYWI